MRLSIAWVSASSFLLLTGCSAQEKSPSAAAASKTAGIQSIYTDLAGQSCKKVPDKSDPNNTPYLVCPGFAGYTLIVRQVDSGRESIDVVDAEQRTFSLDYQEIVTRHMFTLGDKAEWRVAPKDGRQVPIALLVRVRAQEDDKNPEKVTRSYVAVAKITPTQACVTDSIPEETKSDADVRRVADAAQQKKCAPSQPPLTANRTVIR